MSSRHERLVAFGFPVTVPGDRLRCSGQARVRVSGELGGDGERQIAMAVGARLGRDLGRAAERRAPFDQAVAQAEEALRAAPPSPEVELVGIETLQLTTGDGREVFARRAPAAASEAASAAPAGSAGAAGSAVMAYWEGHWYPARVLEVAGEQAKVQWEGASSLAWVPVAQLRPRS